MTSKGGLGNGRMTPLDRPFMALTRIATPLSFAFVSRVLHIYMRLKTKRLFSYGIAIDRCQRNN